MTAETKYRGWLIEQNYSDEWEATGPNYDASYEGEETGWVSNGESVRAHTLEDLKEEIDHFEEELRA